MMKTGPMAATRCAQRGFDVDCLPPTLLRIVPCSLPRPSALRTPCPDGLQTPILRQPCSSRLLVAMARCWHLTMRAAGQEALRWQ